MNGQGMAFILPNNVPNAFDVYRHFENEAERKRLIEEQKAEKAKAHEAALFQYMTKEWNDKEVDGLLNDRVSEKKSQYTKLLKENPGMSMTDLAVMMQKDLGEISTWNKKIKDAHAVIKSQAEDYKKLGNIKHGRAAQIATENLLFKKDDKGNKALKTADEIDLGKDYFDEALSQFPRELMIDEPSIDSIIKDAPVSKIGDNYKAINPKGGYIDKKFTAELYPFQEIIEDEKSGEREVRTKGEPVVEGKPTKMATKENYDWFVSKRDRKMFVDAKFKEYVAGQVAQGRAPIPEKSEEAEKIKRVIVYGMLDDKSTPKNIQKGVVEKANPAPVTHTSITVTTGDKNQDTTQSNAYKILYDAVNGNSYDGKALDMQYPIDGKRVMPVKDILPELGGELKVTNPKAGGKPVQPDHILYNPNNRNTGFRVVYTVKDGLNTTQEHFDVPKKDLEKWLRQSARANTDGTNFTKTDEMIRKVFGGTPVDKALDKATKTTRRTTTTSR